MSMEKIGCEKKHEQDAIHVAFGGENDKLNFPLNSFKHLISLSIPFIPFQGSGQYELIIISP